MIQPSIISTITASFQTNGCFRASKGQSVPQNQKTLKLRSPCAPVWSAENSWVLWKQIARLLARFLWDPEQLSLLLRTFPPPAEPRNHLSCCLNPDLYPCWPAKSRLWEGGPQQSPCLWSSWVTLSHTHGGDGPLPRDFIALVCPAHLVMGELPRARASLSSSQPSLPIFSVGLISVSQPSPLKRFWV